MLQLIYAVLTVVTHHKFQKMDRNNKIGGDRPEIFH